MAAVARVDEDRVQPVHDRLATALGHVRADVQELWVAHILSEEPRNRQLQFTTERNGQLTLPISGSGTMWRDRQEPPLVSGLKRKQKMHPF